MLRLPAWLAIALTLWTAQASGPSSLPAAPRPVIDLTKPPDAAAIHFSSFHFQRPTFLHAGIGLGRIREQPSAGLRYVVEASLSNFDAIASAAFAAIDESGREIQSIPMARMSDAYTRFAGMMVVPIRPFRIELRGETLRGQKFRRIYREAFSPTDAPPPPLQAAPGITDEMLALIEKMIDVEGPAHIAGIETLLANSPKGPIVLPHTRVFNVTYAPSLSAAARPVGIRIEYDVEFTQTGQYEPRLSVLPDYKDNSSRSTGMDLVVLKSTVTPTPRSILEPHLPIDAGEWPNPLAYGGTFLYDGGPVYHMTLDLVPSYIVTRMNQTSPCLFDKAFETSRDPKKAFAVMESSQIGASYKVSIAGKAFEGRIEDFYGEGTFYRSFLADGITPCPAIPPFE